MKKYFVILVATLIFLPLTVFAAYNDVHYTTDGDIYLSGLGMTLTVNSSTEVSSIVVNSDNIVVTGAYVDATHFSTFSLTSVSKYKLTNDWGRSYQCNLNASNLSVVWNASSSASITITPSADECTGGNLGGSGGGGGGAPSTPAMATTTTGEVTATPSAGGQTTYTNPSGGSLALTIPANAVSVNTDFKVQVVSADSVGASPSSYFMVGNQVYQLTATANGSSVTSFNNFLTITFNYTDTQISGFNESSLVIYYYDNVAKTWNALATAINTVANSATVTINHFTVFALMGKLAQSSSGWTIPAGYEYISSLSRMGLYKSVIKEPGTYRLYGMLRSGWTIPAGYEYISSLSRMGLYKNIIKEPGTIKLYGILK